RLSPGSSSHRSRDPAHSGAAPRALLVTVRLISTSPVKVNATLTGGAVGGRSDHRGRLDGHLRAAPASHHPSAGPVDPAGAPHPRAPSGAVGAARRTPGR